MKYLASESTVCNLFYYFNSCPRHRVHCLYRLVCPDTKTSARGKKSFVRSSNSSMMRIMRCQMLQQKTLWKIYLYNNSFWVVFSCNSNFCAVETQGQAVSLKLFHARVKGESVLFLGCRALFSWWIPFGLVRLSGINPGGSSSVGGSKMYVNNLSQTAAGIWPWPQKKNSFPRRIRKGAILSLIIYVFKHEWNKPNLLAV